MTHEAFPILTVDDLGRTRGFYEQLGFEEVYRFPEVGEPTYVTLQRHGSLLGIGAAAAEHGDSFGYWVYVEDVDASVSELVAAGATVVAVPEDQPWGERVARVRDPAGNLVILGAQL